MTSSKSTARAPEHPLPFEFFDSNVFIGSPPGNALISMPDAATLAAELAARGISRALVWHMAQRDWHAVEGNALLDAELAGRKNLRGCWMLLPPATGELQTKGFFKRMKERRIAAVRVCPDLHRYILGRVAFGSFMEKIVERRIPVILSIMRGVVWRDAYDFLRDFPDAVCIIADAGVHGTDRHFRPLLETYPNVRMETHLLSLTAGCLERAVEDYGAGRFVFGSGFPEQSIEGAVLDLVHADIPLADKRAIAAGNLDAIIAREAR